MGIFMDYIDYHLPAGTCLDERYTIKRVIGEGGFGITYEAVNNALGSRVAIKEFYYRECVTRDSSVTTQISFSSPDRQKVYQQARERFLREARIVSDFNDAPGIISVLDYFEVNDTAYIVMKYLDGVTLQQYLKEHGPFAAETICALMLPMLRSLEKIHNSGIIHRDISPDNIMVLSDGSLCLMDFGAARTYLRETDKSSAIITKNGYTPCEQYDNTMPQGPWNDIYALSAVLYTCITGKVPDSSLQRLLLDTLKYPSELGIAIPSALEAILKKGLSVQPEKRFRTLGEYVQELEKCLPRENDQDIKKRRHKRIAIAAGGLVLVLLTLFAFFYRTHTEFFKFYGTDTAHFILYPKDDMPTTEYYDAIEIIENRLKILTDNRYIMEEKGGYLRCVVPLKSCGNMNLMNFIRIYISRPVNPYLDGTLLSTGDLTDLEILETENDTYLTFSLNTADGEQIRRDIQEGKQYFFTLDNDLSVCYYQEIQITEDGKLCIPVPGEENLPQLMLQNLSSPRLSDSFYIQYEPVVSWEDSQTSLIRGTYQVNAEDIPEPFIICELSSYTAPDRGNWYHVLSDFKSRLDSLEIPYAFGTDVHEEKHILFRIAQEDYCDMLMHVLLQKASDITLTAGTTVLYPSTGFSMETEEQANGSFRIWFIPTSSYQVEELDKIAAESDSPQTVFLRCDDIILASGFLADDVSGKKICLNYFGTAEDGVTENGTVPPDNAVTADRLPLFRLIQSCLYDTTMPVSYTEFSTCLSGVTESRQEIQASRSGWDPNEEKDYLLLEELNQKIPELVKARFSLDDSGYRLFLTLPAAVDEMTSAQRCALIKNILLICASEEGRIPNIQIEKLQKDDSKLVDWRFYFYYEEYKQTYAVYFSAFTAEYENVCLQLQEDLQNDKDLENRLTKDNT